MTSRNFSQVNKNLPDNISSEEVSKNENMSIEIDEEAAMKNEGIPLSNLRTPTSHSKLGLAALTSSILMATRFPVSSFFAEYISPV